MKKVLDELYALKRTLQNEIDALKNKPIVDTTNDYDGGHFVGKREGRLEAKEWMMIQLDQTICNVLK